MKFRQIVNKKKAMSKKAVRQIKRKNPRKKTARLASIKKK